MNNDLVNSIKSKITEIDNFYNKDGKKKIALDESIISYKYIFDKLKELLKEEEEAYKNADDEEKYSYAETKYRNTQNFIAILEEEFSMLHFIMLLLEQRDLFNSLKTDINKFISECNQSKTGEIATVMARQSNINLPPDIRNTIASFNKGGKSKKKNRKTKRRYT
jgi:hypothetical protein